MGWITRKRVCVLVLLLAGGAIVNVAVAWGVVMWSAPWEESRDYDARDDQLSWIRKVPANWPTPFAKGGSVVAGTMYMGRAAKLPKSLLALGSRFTLSSSCIEAVGRCTRSSMNDADARERMQRRSRSM